MPLSDEQKNELAEAVREYNDTVKNSLFPSPQHVLRLSGKIINLLALAAGVSVESE